MVYLPPNAPLSTNEILELLTSPTTELLRNHHRSIVEKKNYSDIDYVTKQPNNKNLSQWIRFTTLYRDSEVVTDMKSQLLLGQLGIKATSPVAALERRKLGMVIDSKVIYKFKNGSEITEQHYPQIINIMTILHDNGYLHDDPHSNNFLQDNGSVFVIDCKPNKNWFFEFGVAHNNVCLARRCENPVLFYKLLGKSPEKDALYKLSNYLINLQQIRRALKNKLKKSIGIGYKK